MKIKICGLNPIKDVQICINHKVNYLGFVFYEKSPRNVNLKDIKALSKYDKKNSAFVAVTVNPSDQFIKENLLGNFEYIQLHGSETRQRTNEIKNMGFKVIKTVKVKEEKDIEMYKKFIDSNIISIDEISENVCITRISMFESRPSALLKCLVATVSQSMHEQIRFHKFFPSLFLYV